MKYFLLLVTAVFTSPVAQFASQFSITGEIGDLPFLDSPPGTCPPPGFASKSNLDINAYISHRWYVQEQMNIKYLAEEDNFCVSARYELAKPTSVVSWAWLQPLLKWLRMVPGEIPINVYNSANSGSVTGKQQIGNLSAVVLDPAAYPSQLMVGPKFLPRLFWGPYWVLAAGPGPDKYTWAVISGGPPKKKGNDGYCKTGSGSNDAGLWLFTDTPEVSADRFTFLRTVAKGLGFDTSVLKPVVQKGCTYPSP